MKMTEDFRLKKCPICHYYWVYVDQDVCPNCKSKGYHVETKRMENPIGFEREESIKLKVKKHGQRK